MVFRDVKIRKATKVKKVWFPKKILEWFGPRLFDTISFNKDGVINQRKLVFKKNSSQTELVENKCTLIYLSGTGQG